jgi:histidine ammonia-lyase
VLGTVAANLAHARRRVVAQARAVADNPLVLGDGRVWHGGLFYALPLATVADLLVDAANRIGELLDRQLLLLVTPPLNHGLPPNLAAPEAGHVKGLHQLATALTQELRGAATLSCVRSTSSESHNQDVVPGAMTALHHAHRALGVAEQIARIATFGAERAVWLRRTGRCPASHTLDAWRARAERGGTPAAPAGRARARRTRDRR